MNWQVILCGLTHFSPIELRPRWKSRALTKTLLGRREGWMRIFESEEIYGTVITLELKRESEDEMSSLQDLLITMGYAPYCEDSVNNTWHPVII
ncbi:hypothetical protein ALC53_04342 [Atta colombica]|uniref:Uncharacterized protein n=1 Tax=Atta colombica TaxID=520822 RepID=A0A151I4Z0_9HYME|nr:hypothetical protein ALC53_04342 [Atta colombica]